MTTPVEGSLAPPVTLVTNGGPVSIPDPGGKPVILMFFEEALTPACSNQVASLYSEAAIIEQLGAIAVCVSADPLERQLAFAGSLGIPPTALASDVEGNAARAYGVFDAASKRAHRSAFVAGGDGILKLAIPWYNPANSEQLLAVFSALGFGGADAETQSDG